MQGPLTGKTALVTGAGRNIGRAIVLELASQGANVIINVRTNRAEADAVAAEVRARGAEAVVVLGDVAALATIETLAREAEAAFGGVDICVSNAMYRKHQAFHDTSIEDWHRYLDMQLGASFYLARTFAPVMARRGWGRIMHITGPDGFVGCPNRIANVVAKGGLRSLTKALARELGPSGITVNDIAPGMHDTVRDPVTHPFVNDPDWITKAVRSIPVGRLGTAEDVAWCCGFLASPRSGFITGQVLGCNGGELMIG